MYGGRFQFKKKYFLGLFLVIILGISVGYSYLNTSLFINGTSIINANVWSVGLSNLDVIGGSVVAVKNPSIDNKTTTTNFEVKLENKEDFYEFTVDVINNGDHDARLNSLVETTGLTTEQANYFDYTVSYQNDGAIQVNQLVKKDDFVRLKIKVSYKENVDITQVPDSVKTLSLGLKLNYDLNDGNGTTVENNGRKIVTPVANGSLDDIGTIVTIGTENFYVIGIEDENVKLLSMYNLYVGGEYKNGSLVTYGDEATGMQDENMKGYVKDQDVRKGVTPIFNNDENIALVYVNEYKLKLENIFGIDVIDARLLKEKEASDSNTFACDYDSSSCSESLYSWIYSTSYWGGEATYNSYEWYIYSDGFFSDMPYGDNDEYLGIRPVIVLAKNGIMEQKKLIEFVIHNDETTISTTYYAEEGMTWEEWVNSSYNSGFFRAGTDSVLCDDGYVRYTMIESGVSLSDIIEANHFYYISWVPGDPL